MQHIRGTLKKILADTLSREGDNAPVFAWPLVCGARIAEKTNAIGYADGVLTVEVADANWRRQLQGLSRQYLTALNEISAQPVNSIKFVATLQATGSSR